MGQVLVDHLGPHAQHVVHQPRQAAGQLAAGFQRHGLDDADQDADGDVGKVIEDIFSRHGTLPSWNGQMFVVPASADPKHPATIEERILLEIGRLPRIVAKKGDRGKREKSSPGAQVARSV